jgi:predicted TIM-barrel fold metal-dependent hydrolase
MYASDWPHWDGDYPNSLFELQQRQDLTEEQRHGVLYRAAERFYGRQ